VVLATSASRDGLIILRKALEADEAIDSDFGRWGRTLQARH
jgi:hypothetical protein